MFILIDSSGSISLKTFNEVKKLLVFLAHLLCGDISIGVMTYSRAIELVLCPMCFRSGTIDPKIYLEMVTQKIEDAVHHGSATHTGEALACLRCSLMNSSTCVRESAPTEIIVFTDGVHNGCIDPKDEVKKLLKDYSNVPMYGIGMGAVDRNGVTDLYGGERNPGSIFSVRDIHMFREVLQEIMRRLYADRGKCVVTDRNELVIQDLLSGQ